MVAAAMACKVGNERVPSETEKAVRIHGWTVGKGGTEWYRIKEPLRGLRIAGHTTTIGPALFDGAEPSSYDALLVRGLHDRWNSLAWWKLGERHRILRWYDIDDDLWQWEKKTEQYAYWTEERLYQAEQNIIEADVVTTPSEKFAEYLRELNRNIVVIPNTIPKWLTQILPDTHYPERKDLFIVGWEGAPHHIDDLELLWGPLFRFMLRHSDVRFHVWGPARDPHADVMPGMQGRVRYTPWIKDVPNYYRSLDMNVCVAPLLPTAFNETKSSIRVQEHSALGIPIIASDSPAYRGYLQPGVNGFFAHGEQNWEDCLELLYTDRMLRHDLGRAGRELARSWTTEATVGRWEAILTREEDND